MGYRRYKRSGQSRHHQDSFTPPTRKDSTTHPLLAGIIALYRFLFGRNVRRPVSSQPEGLTERERSTAPRTNYDRRKASGWEAAAARAASHSLPYKPQRSLLSRGERAFWHPLYHAVKGRYRIFCKVRLADIVCCPSNWPDERRWFRKIGNYHVDFVICDPKTTAPLLMIELDDRTHRQPKRKARDEFKDTVIRAAGLPMLRIRAQAAYDPIEMKASINALLSKQAP